MRQITIHMNGILPVTIPTIRSGGYYLLQTLAGKHHGPALIERDVPCAGV